MLPQLIAADHHMVNFIRTIGKAQGACIRVHIRQWCLLRDAKSAVHLNRLVDDLADARA
jgi:hypothetical protein